MDSTTEPTFSTYEARVFSDPEAFGAVAAYVAREYGPTGYRIGVVVSSGAVTIFEVVHSDGSRFNLVADRYGTVRRPATDSRGAVETLTREMHRAAVTL